MIMRTSAFLIAFLVALATARAFPVEEEAKQQQPQDPEPVVVLDQKEPPVEEKPLEDEVKPVEDEKKPLEEDQKKPEEELNAEAKEADEESELEKKEAPKEEAQEEKVAEVAPEQGLKQPEDADIFHKHDQDIDGFIDQSEFQKAYQFPEDVIQKAFSGADADENLKLDRDEFSKVSFDDVPALGREEIAEPVQPQLEENKDADISVQPSAAEVEDQPEAPIAVEVQPAAPIAVEAQPAAPIAVEAQPAAQTAVEAQPSAPEVIEAHPEAAVPEAAPAQMDSFGGEGSEQPEDFAEIKKEELEGRSDQNIKVAIPEAQEEPISVEVSSSSDEQQPQLQDVPEKPQDIAQEIPKEFSPEEVPQEFPREEEVPQEFPREEVAVPEQPQILSEELPVQPEAPQQPNVIVEEARPFSVEEPQQPDVIVEEARPFSVEEPEPVISDEPQSIREDQDVLPVEAEQIVEQQQQQQQEPQPSKEQEQVIPERQPIAPVIVEEESSLFPHQEHTSIVIPETVAPQIPEVVVLPEVLSPVIIEVPEQDKPVIIDAYRQQEFPKEFPESDGVGTVISQQY